MSSQIRYVTKEEAHKIIDELPNDKFWIITYESEVGISKKGKFVKKRKTLKIVDKAKTLTLSESRISTLSCLLKEAEECKNTIVKSIMIPPKS